MAAGVRNNLDRPPDLSSWSPQGSRRACGPLSPQEVLKLNQAGIRQKKILRAVKIATFNGWCTGVAAAVALAGGVFNVLSLVMGLALAALAWNEFRGRKLLQDMDVYAPRILGWNQLAFMGLLIAYSVWHIYSGLTGPSAYQAQIAAHPQLESMFGITRLERMLTVSLYGTMIAATIIFQGGCAWYYFSRTKYLHAYISDTEPWILRVQRASQGS